MQPSRVGPSLGVSATFDQSSYLAIRPRVSPAAWNSLTIIPSHLRVEAFDTPPGNNVSSRDRDFRPSRRRGFDDENFEAPRHSFGSPFSAQRFEAPAGPPVQ